MEEEEHSQSFLSPPLIVYVHGSADNKEEWYRFEFDTTFDELAVVKPITNDIVEPIASLNNDKYGYKGGWTLVGNDICWFGPKLCHIFKHNIYSPDNWSWDQLSRSCLSIPRSYPILSQVGRKLCLVGGRDANHDRPEDWLKVGQAYDLDFEGWKYMDDAMYDLEYYNVVIELVAGRELTKPGGFMFYSFELEPNLIYVDVLGHSIDCDFLCRLDQYGNHCLPFDDEYRLFNWENKIKIEPTCINKSLYWFTHDLRIYEFDSTGSGWFRSPYLAEQLPTFEFSVTNRPIFTAVGKGKFLLIANVEWGILKMASLTVVREDLSLRVSVHSIQTFSCGSANFLPSDAKALMWGLGQSVLEKARICLLTCGPTGYEILKNLVLDGVRDITIVDDGERVEGETEALAVRKQVMDVCDFLKGLNGAVRVRYEQTHPEKMIRQTPSFFSQFTIVIATQLREFYMIDLERICREENTMLIFAHSYGLMGRVRISVKEHTVVESKPDHFPDDLRVNNTWPELQGFADAIDLNSTDAEAHKQIPYVIILVKIAQEWANTHGGNFPFTREEKNQFKDLIKSKMITMDEENYKEAMDAASYTVFSPQGVGPNLQKILDDSCTEIHSTSSDFWVMVAALKEFIANEGGGETPLEGSIPDMTSSTELYVNLQKTYQAKAEGDFLLMEKRVRNLLKKIGRDTASITKAHIRSFCKNARKLAVCRYRLVKDEFKSPLLPELQKYLTDEDYGSAAGLYILIQAVARFPRIYPTSRERREWEIAQLSRIAVDILDEVGCNDTDLSEDFIRQALRCGISELTATAAFVGGVASQEVIKLITREYIPMSGTFMFNGIDQKSQLLLL